MVTVEMQEQEDPQTVELVELEFLGQELLILEEIAHLQMEDLMVDAHQVEEDHLVEVGMVDIILNHHSTLGTELGKEPAG